MAWGFDFDIGSIFDDIGSSIVDVGTSALEGIKNMSAEDAASLASIGSSIYFQQKTLEAQEDALDAQYQATLDAMDETPSTLTELESATVDIGEADITSDAEAAAEAEEAETNVGRITLDDDVYTESGTTALTLTPTKLGLQI